MKKFLIKNRKVILLINPILFSLLVSLILVIIKKGEIWSNIFFIDRKDGFMDFFNSISISINSDIYKKEVIYPPFVYYIYRIFAYLLPQNIIKKSPYLIVTTYEGQIIYMLYILICSYLSIWSIQKLTKNNNFSSLISMAFLLSCPVLYCFQRGNIIILAFIFAAIFFIFYNSKNKFLKHLSLISLAISANIKIYPALFGLILIKEKRYKDAIYCVIYGIALFVLPFFSFGGLGAILDLIKNIFLTNFYVPDLCQPYLISLDSTITTILSLITNNINTSLINKLLLLLFPISMPAFLYNNKLWKDTLLICLLFICIPNLSYTYSLMFLFIPAIMIINEKENDIIDYICLSIISILLCTYGFVPQLHGYYFFVILEKILTSILLIIMIIDGYIQVIKSRRITSCQK